MEYRRPGYKMQIGLISAIPSEGSFFVKRLKLKRTRRASLIPFYSGEVEGLGIVYFISGMGKTNAAHAASVLMRDYSPSIVINFGAGGAYPHSGLGVGDVIVADAETYGDEGVLDEAGFHGTEFLGIPLLKKSGRRYFNEFGLNRGLAGRAVKSAVKAFEGAADAPKVGRGRFVTVSTCSGTRQRAAEVQKMWGAVCENMEGAAIAHICALYGVPLIEIRGVSNIVEDRDTAKWDLELASRNCCKAVAELLKALRVP